MKKFPPVILVDTWLYLIKNQTTDLEQIKLPLRRVIKSHFGTMELAQLYVDQFLDKDINFYLV